MFDAPPEGYDRFMGRYARALAPRFATFAGVAPPAKVLDVGCGPGALTGVLAGLVGATSVAAADPSPTFASACAARVPGAHVRHASMGSLPWPDGAFDVALAQLVLHFVPEPAQGLAEMARVVRPGGVVAACTWDGRGGMAMLGTFWDAALDVDPRAPVEGVHLPFGTPDELQDVFVEAGLLDVRVEPLDVEAAYEGFDDLWAGFGFGVGPSGAWLATRAPEERAAIEAAYRARLPAEGPFVLRARSWAARGHAAPR